MTWTALRAAAGALVAASLVACSAEPVAQRPPPAPTSSSAPTPTDAPTTTAAPTYSPSDDRDLDVDELVVPPAAATWPATWRERFVIGYGPGEELLGTSPGGDSGTLDLGPEYGAPAADGSWWFLDAAKQRLAHYDPAGRYVGQVRIARRLLVSGQYFQWQLPHVLADGTLVAARQDGTRTWLLRLRDGRLDEIPVDGVIAPAYDDGVLVYGFGGGGNPVVVDPSDGSLRAVATFATPGGTPFRVTVGRRLRVELPASGLDRRLRVRTPSGAPAHVGLQVRAGADETLHLFLAGTGEDDESVQLVGATTVAPSGQVAEVEALPDPFSEADPGSPAQLVLAPGTSTPMLVYVLPDGVHVYERRG